MPQVALALTGASSAARAGSPIRVAGQHLPCNDRMTAKLTTSLKPTTLEV